MASLWTPDGEHRIENDEATRRAEPTPKARSDAAEERPEGASDDDEELRAELAQLEAELLAAPAEAVVANHCYGLFQLAALHLGQRPPQLPEAKLAIDALGAIVEQLGDRLGESAATLRDGLAQLRLAFVQISSTEGSPSAQPGDPTSAGGPG